MDLEKMLNEYTHKIAEMCEDLEKKVSDITNEIAKITNGQVENKPRLSADELEILKCLDSRYKFIARDGRGNLYIFGNLPIRIEKIGVWTSSINCEFFGFNQYFLFIKCEDELPYNIKELVDEATKYYAGD